ncbi:hypothetical protein [Frankia sp. ArI3]|uniref:hypothetical protein n=1 Tax=Frankia sp. ArI3 TaxID=1858 RepID=UPI001C6FCE4D|nr:hypothetical protein [Frankia sp. ArI3]
MTLQNGTPIQLGERLARAGEGTVWDVVGRPEWVAKIFHPDLKGLVAKREKVTAMTRVKPAGTVSRDGSIVLTWPQHLVLEGGVVRGYVMLKVDTRTTVEIHSVSNPTDRRGPLPNQPQWPRRADWAFLLNTAANLCIAVEAAHRVGAVIGDFQERNILVSDTSRVTLVDCDSMQFTAASGRRYLCDVGRPEFTAPELRNVDLKKTPRDRSSDLFALAVHLHLLLMNGNHPFSRGSVDRPRRAAGCVRSGRRRPLGGRPTIAAQNAPTGTTAIDPPRPDPGTLRPGLHLRCRIPHVTSTGQRVAAGTAGDHHRQVQTQSKPPLSLP